MWNWEQGRMQYFQFDALRRMASFILVYDFKNCDREFLLSQIPELPFKPAGYKPWRNYARLYKLCLLVSEMKNESCHTAVTQTLVDPDTTCDEYMQFLVKAISDPSPAFSNWRNLSRGHSLRYPLCFSLKYILTKFAGFDEDTTSIDEIIDAYGESGFSGREDYVAFRDFIQNHQGQPSLMFASPNYRQARESIQFMGQISYLQVQSSKIRITTHQTHALDIFRTLNPIPGHYKIDAEEEIQRVATYFRRDNDRSIDSDMSTFYGEEEIRHSGFKEGNRVTRKHIARERSSTLLKAFFEQNPTSICDACGLDTSGVYTWADRVLELHHIFPLASGSDSQQITRLEDIVPLCPTCHRAIHKYYDQYLAQQDASDFSSKSEAQDVYNRAKKAIRI